MIEATQPRLCQVRSQTDLPCGRAAVATIWGVRFCGRCAREQEDYFTVGELTQVPTGASDATEGVGHAARSSRSSYPAAPRGRRREPVAKSIKASLLLLVAVLSALATACGGAGQASGGSAEAEAKVEPETTARAHARAAEGTAEGNEGRGTAARADGDDGAVARSGGAVARAGDAQARTSEVASEVDDGETSQKNAAKDHPREDRPRKIHPEELALEVRGDPGTNFSGVCSVGEKEKAIAGRVPERYAFEPGEAGLECEIRKEGGGALEVVVAGEGIRSVQRTAAGEGTIRFALSRDSISSSTSSISLNQTTSSSDRSSADASR